LIDKAHSFARAIVVIVAVAAASTPALAGGGPHFVDDAGTVAPGSCELEGYGNFGPGGAWRLVISPTCAFKALGNFEIGVIAAADGPPGVHIIPGIAAKAGLGQIGGAAIAAEISLGFDPEGNRLDAIATSMPIGITPLPWLAINANIGMDFQPGDAPIPTYGLAALIEPVDGWQLVGEVAGRRGFATRAQWGVRHSTAAIDIDVMYSRNVDDQARGDWVTFGMTWRFQHGW